jgi:hypothetical protein
MTDDVFHSLDALRELTIHDQDGLPIGSVGQVYVDDGDRHPEWVTVRTGLHGAAETFVPLEGAVLDADGALRVPYSLDTVKDAPRMHAEEHLDLDQEQELYLHYGLTPPEGQSSGAPGVGDGRPRAPLSGEEKGLENVKELIDEPPTDVPRLRRFDPADSDDATATGSGTRGENR